MNNNQEPTESTLFSKHLLQLLLIITTIIIGIVAWKYIQMSKITVGYVLYATCIFPLAAYKFFQRGQGFPPYIMNRKLEIILLIIIVIAGSYLRIHRITELPPGLWFDEAENAQEAARILDGNYYPIYTQSYYSKETFYIYFIALFFKLFGYSAVNLRLVSVVFGIISIPVMYVFLKYLFGSRVSLGATALFATSHWHLFFSRVGFRAILMIPISILAIYYLFKATDQNKKKYYILAGIFLAMGYYTYIPFRTVSLLFFIYILCLSICKKGFIKSHFTGLVIYSIVTIICLSPLLYFVITKPHTYLGRVSQASLSKLYEGEELKNQIKTNIILYLKMFHFYGDTHSRHNLPGKPALTYLMALTATPGFLLIIMQFWKSRNIFYLLWFIFMMLPGILTIPPQNFLRTLNVLPLVFICSAVFLEHLFRSVQGVFAHDSVLLHM